MGVVPLGTFNYFAREQALSLDPAQAVQDILQALQAGQMRPVNVGLVNERLFLVNASLGLYPRLLDERERASTRFGRTRLVAIADRKSTRLNSSHLVISYAVFCLKKKTKQDNDTEF